MIARFRSVVRRAGAALSEVVGALELRDVAFLAGLGLAAWGGVQISPPWTAIVVGGLLTLLSLPTRRSP